MTLEAKSTISETRPGIKICEISIMAEIATPMKKSFVSDIF